MSSLQLALWGLAGGFTVEGLELVAAIRRTRGWPWRIRGEVGLGPYLASVAIRLAVSSILAVALGLNGQVTGPGGALMIGITAPLIVEKAFRHIATIPVTFEETAEPVSGQYGTAAGTTATAAPGARLETGDAT